MELLGVGNAKESIFILERRDKEFNINMFGINNSQEKEGKRGLWNTIRPAVSLEIEVERKE